MNYSFVKVGVILCCSAYMGGCTDVPFINSSSDRLTLDVARKSSASHTVAAGPTVQMAQYTDARRNAPSRKIGDVRETVIDMSTPDLIMDDDIANLVSAAMKRKFDENGFQVVGTKDKLAASAIYEISGTIREFNLDIAARDELAMVIETTLRDTRSNDVVWSGVVTEESDRFAGVTGNTKKSITQYLGQGLDTVTNKTVVAISNAIKQLHPEQFQQLAPAMPATAGVAILVSPTAPAPTLSAPAAPMAALPQQTVAHAATGYLAIRTTPTRVKVYVDDVYYGFSPLKLEFDAGIYVLHFKLEGYKPATEKVSIRKNETTELDMSLKK